MPHALETLALFPTGLSPRRAELEIHDHCEGKLWMAAYFPDLPLEALTDPNIDQPTVVADLQNGHKRIVAANLEAIGHGIRPNLKLSAAFALSDSLEVLERCEKSERTKLEALAEQVKQLTPVVSLEPPAALLLEIGGSLKLFGGIDAIKAASMTLLRKARVTAHLCVAPTALAAL